MSASILTLLLPGVVHLLINMVMLSGCVVLAMRTRRPETVAMAVGAAITTVAGVASTVATAAMVSQRLPHQGFAVVSGLLQIGFVLGGLSLGVGLLTFALRSDRSPS